MALVDHTPKRTYKGTPEQWIEERYGDLPEGNGAYDVDYITGALLFLRSFESLSKANKLAYGDCLRQQLPAHLQGEYQWAGKSLAAMTADGATNKDKAIGECLTPSNHALKSIRLTSFEGHAHLYTSARVLYQKHTASTTAGVRTPTRMASESDSEVPPIRKRKPWCGTASLGSFYTASLNDARVQLLVTGGSPKVILRSAGIAYMVGLRHLCHKGIDGVVAGHM